MRPDRRTPVAIVTGFLGSGKTTLLSRVLAEPDMQKVAVIVNEFGAVSIDHRLVARSDEHIVELRNGCVCCTIRGDLVMTLRDLHRRRALGEIAAFDYVVVETTGLADPVPLLQTLIANPPLRQHYYTDVVIACADAEHLETTLADHDCGEAQIAVADIVLITKCDRVGAADRAGVRRRVAQLAPDAEVHEIEHGDIAARRLFRRGLFEPRAERQAILQWLRPLATTGQATPLAPMAMPHAQRHHADGYTSHVLSADGPISLAGTSILLNRLVNSDRERILRIKGILRTRERPGQLAVVHAVRDKFYPVQWMERAADTETASRIVIIARALDVGALEDAFVRNCVH
ncbi:CobW family GTP-binding protein [Sinimarinibacterium flocculans]|uniref:CobW family GTP-binding protein n=1 Tax=Sinimarinibacterium flocculans TaxID=985250 RepID=UPI002490D845|nr:GTP-binding protein [Sinimarinibacterium flocculans]